MTARGAHDEALWRELVASEKRHLRAEWEFANQASNRAAVLINALKNPSERTVALRILLKYVQWEAERMAAFPVLVDLASVGHNDIELVREAIKMLPRQWVIDNIERVAEPVLQAGGDEEFRRLAELFVDLDAKVLARLVVRALDSSNPDIREVGEDFSRS